MDLSEEFKKEILEKESIINRNVLSAEIRNQLFDLHNRIYPNNKVLSSGCSSCVRRVLDKLRLLLKLIKDESA